MHRTGCKLLYISRLVIIFKEQNSFLNVIERDEFISTGKILYFVIPYFEFNSHSSIYFNYRACKPNCQKTYLVRMETQMCERKVMKQFYDNKSQ